MWGSARVGGDPPSPACSDCAVENQGLWLKAYEYNVYLVAFYGQHLGSGVVGRGQLFKPVDQWMENATKTIESHACKSREDCDALISVNGPEGCVQDNELPCGIFVHCSAAQLCLSVPPWTAARRASLSFTISWSLLRLMSIESTIPCNHPILCRPLLLLTSNLSPDLEFLSS